MDERLRFVARLLEGETMVALCEEFGSPENRLQDREYPQLGAPPKAANVLRQRWPEVHCPAISTVHAVLDRHGLVTRRSRRVRRRLTGTSLSWPAAPNRLWCADYKGEFVLGNHRYCYPLTITDFASRYLLACEALSTTKERYAFTVFERAFQEHGLPDAIRTDNGVPFASAHALYGLSKLAVWWLRLGIGLERIAPGHPEQNGRHERLHLTLKNEATRPPSTNVLQQQARFDTFVHQFNHERPHQALDMATPASRYQPSARAYQGVEELEYPCLGIGCNPCLRNGPSEGWRPHRDSNPGFSLERAAS